MVGLATTSLLGLLALLQPTIAAPRHLTEPHHEKTCVSNGNLYHSGTSYLMFGNSYFVHCGKDSTGQVLHSLTVPGGGFSDCSRTCGIMDECGGFSFIGGIEDGACYFKTGLGDLTHAFGDAVSCSLDPDGNGVHPEPVPASYPGSDSYGSTSLTASAPAASSYVSGNTGSPSSASAVSSPSLSLSAYTSPLASPTAAAPTPPALDQCQQTVKESGNIYRGGNGSPYELECGKDHYGDDLTAAGSYTFLGCINICNANPECIGYSYLGGVCYLKKYLTALNSNPAVNFALNLDRNSTAKPPPSSTSAAATSPKATAIPEPVPGSCGYIAANGIKTYTNGDNIQYIIECDTDHNGGDIGTVGTKDFVGCMYACNKKDMCIAFSWVGGNGPGTCYLKGTITGIEHDVDIDYAYKKVPTDIPALHSSSASSHGSESTSAGVASSLLPTPTTSVSLSSHASISTASSYASSDSGGVLTVTVTSYTGSATPSSSSTKRIVHPQPDPYFPWLIWPNPTKLKVPDNHSPSVHEPHPEPAPATSYSSPANTKTIWVTSASPTPSMPNVPPYHPPDGPPPPPFGVPPLVAPPDRPAHPPDRPQPHPQNGPPSVPFGQPPKIPNGVPPFNQPDLPRPNPYSVPRIPYYGEPPFFPPNVKRSVSDEPTKTFAKKPLEPTSVGDNAYCEQLRSRKPKKLHCEVTHGDYKFNGMWVQDPTRGQY